MAKNFIIGTEIRAANFSFFFFSEIWLRQSIAIMVRYQRVKYKKKTNNTILRKFNDGQTDGQTGRQIDKQQE